MADAWDGYTKALGAEPSGVTASHQWKAIGPAFADRNAATLTEADCQRYVVARRKLGRSENYMVGTELPAISAPMGGKQAPDRPGAEDMDFGSLAASRQTVDAGTSQSLYRRLHASTRKVVCHPRRDDRRSHGCD